MRKLIALVPLGCLLAVSSCGNQSMEGTIYYKAVDQVWQSLSISSQTMTCDWADDPEGPKAARALIEIGLKFDLNLKIDENKAKYESAIDEFLKKNC